jgi:hypothetical protein
MVTRTVLTIIYPHVYFPTYSNGLKEVAGCLGCHWTEPDASGIESVVWRKNWEKTSDASWKAKLIQYNIEDCDALRRVCAFLSEAPDSGAKSQPDATPREASVAQLDKLARTVTWGQFAHADFEFVNKRAYFDYQRRHVFVRTKAARQRPSRKTQRRRWQNRDLRATHRVEITATRCPFCKSKHIVPLDPKRQPKGVQTRHTRAFDLVITPGAIRRKAIEFRTVAYRCTRLRTTLYSRALRAPGAALSWLHELVRVPAHHASTRGYFPRGTFPRNLRNPGVLLGVHGFPAPARPPISQDLRHAARATHRGPVLHIDETAVKLKDGSGYVWVFANTSAAVYIFRQSLRGGPINPRAASNSPSLPSTAPGST